MTATANEITGRINGFKAGFAEKLNASADGFISRERVKSTLSQIGGATVAEKTEAMRRIDSMSNLPKGAELHILPSEIASRVLAETQYVVIRRAEKEAEKAKAV